MTRRVSGSSRSYRPISDYALIGDARTAALVSSDGSIDWCCCPRFDSSAVFCRLLDAEKGGYYRVGPVAPYTSSRSYIGRTNVLATTFTTDTGRIRLTDFMPIRPRGRGSSGNGTDSHLVLRLVEGVAGVIDWEPVPGDWGAHGRFDDRARAGSAQLLANMYRRWILLAAVAFLLAAVVLAILR